MNAHPGDIYREAPNNIEAEQCVRLRGEFWRTA